MIIANSYPTRARGIIVKCFMLMIASLTRKGRGLAGEGSGRRACRSGRGRGCVLLTDGGKDFRFLD